VLASAALAFLNASANRKPAISQYELMYDEIVCWSWHPQISKKFDEDKLELSTMISGPDFGSRLFMQEVSVKKAQKDATSDSRLRLTISISIGEFPDPTLPEYEFQVGPILEECVVSHDEFNDILRSNSLPLFSPQ